MHTPHAATSLACLALAGPAMALDASQIFARASAAVAVLESFDENGGRLGAHSATVVGPELLVASCEALEAAATLRVSTKGTGAAGVAASATARDRERNLCLLAAPGLGAAALPRRTGALAVGSKVFALSNALGLGVGISEGILAGSRRFPNGDYAQFSAPISPGSEGGALVDDAGRLVGIIDYRRRDGQNVNFAAAAQSIDEIVARAAAAAARLRRFDQAMALLKRQQWGPLHDMAAAWSEAEPDAADAWRFVVAAAKARADGAAELRGWQALRRIDPASADTGTGLGQALMAGGKPGEALALARQLQAAHPEDAGCWQLLGQAQQVLGQVAEADQSYRRAAELDPWLIDAYAGMARLAQLRGDGKAAVAIWARLAGLYPDQLRPRIGLVDAYLTANQPARAWAALARLAEADADSALAWYLKGIVLHRLDCPEQAAQAFRNSLERKLPGADQAWAGIGYAMAVRQRWPEAIAAFRAARQAAPDNDEWAYQLAIALKDGGRAPEALTLTAALVAKAPEQAQHWRQHGFVLAVLGRPAEAIPAMQHSLEMDPRQAKLWHALIETYQVAGRRDDARRAYERLRAVDGAKAEGAYRAVILPYEEQAQ